MTTNPKRKNLINCTMAFKAFEISKIIIYNILYQSFPHFIFNDIQITFNTYYFSSDCLIYNKNLITHLKTMLLM